MLGNSSGGGNIGRTAVGVRGLTRATPARSQKIAKKQGVDEDGKLDRVDRDGRNDRMMELLEGKEEERAEEELAQPTGHGMGVTPLDDDAFRSDKAGRPIPPVFGDVDQGNLGDSWLLASLAAVAHAQPAELVRRVQRIGAASFNVRLGEEEIRVKAEFSNEGYASPTPNGQKDTLWVALVEKAFALRESMSYQNLEGGNPGRALDALTGARSKKTSISELTKADALYKALREGKSATRAMVLRTRPQNVASPLHPEHNYAVLDVFERGKSRIVKIYNPWGTKNNSRPLSSMVHELELEAIRRDCESLHLSGS